MLETAAGQQEPALLRSLRDPDFDELREEPRFLAVLERVGSPDAPGPRRPAQGAVAGAASPSVFVNAPASAALSSASSTAAGVTVPKYQGPADSASAATAS